MNTHGKTQLILLVIIAILLSVAVVQKIDRQEAEAAGTGMIAGEGLSACLWNSQTESVVLVDQGSQSILLYSLVKGSEFELVGARTYKWDMLLKDSSVIPNAKPNIAWTRGIGVKTVYEWYNNPKRMKEDAE